MKIAFYMAEDGEQIVLTPESDFERSMLGKLHDEKRVLSIKQGNFFECMGGYYRHTIDTSEYGKNDSTMLVIRSKGEAA